MRVHPIVLALILCWPALIVLTAPAQTRMTICAQVKVRLPSLEQHRASLAENPRYGPELAEDFDRRAKPSGDDYLHFQVHYFAEYPGASGWFDIVGLTGLAESEQVSIKDRTCSMEDYPLVLLIGIEPKSVRNGTLYVVRRKNITTLVSLRHSAKANRPIPMRLRSSGRLVCADLRTAVFDDEDRSCADVSSFFRR